MTSMGRWRRWRLLLWASSAALLLLFVGLLALERFGPRMVATTKNERDASLPVLYQAPSFSLVNQDEQQVSDAELRGKIVVANFIYTHCTDICPLLTAQMQQLQQHLQKEELLGDQVQLLSFTVDPARDTPAILRAYGQRFAVDIRHWQFLTGAESRMRPLIVAGFHLGVEALARGENPESAEGQAHEHDGGMT